MNIKIYYAILRLAVHAECEVIDRSSPEVQGYVVLNACEIPCTEYWTPQRIHAVFQAAVEIAAGLGRSNLETQSNDSYGESCRRITVIRYCSV